MNKNRWIILLVGLLDVMSIGFIIPTLPDLAKFYGVETHLISYGVTVYALAAFIATPFLGQLSDIFGRKKMLLLCVVGSFFSAFLIAIAQTYTLFIVGRIINGITGGNIGILASMINDISKTKEERAANMGLMGSIFGMGFIIGPLFGAILLHYSVQLPYWAMVILSLFEILVLIFGLRETNEHIVKKPIVWNPFLSLGHAAKSARSRVLLISFTILITAFALYQSILSLFLAEKYNLSGSFSGYVMAGSGLILVLNQIFLLKQFWLKRFSRNQLLSIMNIAVFVILLILGWTSTLWLFLVFILLLLPFRALLDPVYQSEIIEVAHIHRKGEVMGILSSLQSLGMFLGPLLGGFLLEYHYSIFSFSAGLVAISLVIMLWFLWDEKKKASSI